MTILKPHDEKFSNSCEGKEFARRTLNCIYIYSSKAKAFIESISESSFNPYIVMFNFCISVGQENAGRKWDQGVSCSYLTQIVNKIVMILTLVKCCEESSMYLGYIYNGLIFNLFLIFLLFLTF